MLDDDGFTALTEKGAVVVVTVFPLRQHDFLIGLVGCVMAPEGNSPAVSVAVAPNGTLVCALILVVLNTRRVGDDNDARASTNSPVRVTGTEEPNENLDVDLVVGVNEIPSHAIATGLFASAHTNGDTATLAAIVVVAPDENLSAGCDVGNDELNKNPVVTTILELSDKLPSMDVADELTILNE